MSLKKGFRDFALNLVGLGEPSHSVQSEPVLSALESALYANNVAENNSVKRTEISKMIQGDCERTKEGRVRLEKIAEEHYEDDRKVVQALGGRITYASLAVGICAGGLFNESYINLSLIPMGMAILETVRVMGYYDRGVVRSKASLNAVKAYLSAETKNKIRELST